ncbi:MAG: SPOR domain-containing protein [Thiolinea sp.]
MTRDFKQNGTTAQSSQYGISWVLGGVAVGLLAGAVAYALMSKPELANLVGSNTPVQTTQAQTSPGTSTLANGSNTAATLEDKPEEDNRPGFSYHAVLPQLELDVPIPAPREAAPANTQKLPQVEQTEVAQQQQPAQQQTQAVNNQGRYMFQLGAYRDRGQAVQMQRRARQNGMNTRVEPAKVNGQTWYRVRLGPTDNLQIVNRWKQRLSGMGINPMMIRL